jgi:hypothetical protein
MRFIGAGIVEAAPDYITCDKCNTLTSKLEPKIISHAHSNHVQNLATTTIPACILTGVRVFNMMSTHGVFCSRPSVLTIVVPIRSHSVLFQRV